MLLVLVGPCCWYKKVELQLIKPEIRSHGQGADDYTSCFKNHLCYRLTFKSLALGMFVFDELSYRKADPQRRRSTTKGNFSQTLALEGRDRKRRCQLPEKLSTSSLDSSWNRGFSLNLELPISHHRYDLSQSRP